jgi:hypothetical protein
MGDKPYDLLQAGRLGHAATHDLLMRDFGETTDGGELLAEVVMNILADTVLLFFADVEDLFLKLLPITQVTNDASENTATVRQTCLTHGEVDGEDAAVFSLGHGLTSDADDFPHTCGEIILHEAVMLGPVRFRHEHADVFTDHLLPSVAKKTLRGGVHRFDEPILAHGDDRIHRCFHDGTAFLLRGTQRLTHGNQVRQVTPDAENAGHPALSILDV